MTTVREGCANVEPGDQVSQIEMVVARLYPTVMVEVKRYGRPKSTTIIKADCPAASAEFANGVIGFRQPDEECVTFFEQTVEFPRVLRMSSTDAEIESRLRLVGRCVQSRCPHWMGSCVLGHAVAATPQIEITRNPRCSIFDTCRWRRENGTQVCAPCAGILNVLMEKV